MYQNIFKGDSPTFSKRAKELISLMGDWYVGEYFSYIPVWESNTVHLYPSIVPDIMVLQEISLHTVIDGVSPKLAKTKRKCWPKFPLNLGFFTFQNSTHYDILGKYIVDMNLVEAPNRMHDTNAFPENHFV